MKQNNGNALFLILIAVALFAALSYAITSSGRGGGNINKEQAEIFASEIASYASLSEQAINRMMLINGCNEYQISFDNPEWPSSVVARYQDSTRGAMLQTPPSDKSCHFFDANGGGMYIAAKEEWLDSSNAAEFHYNILLFTGHPRIKGFGTDTGSATSTSDLVMVFPFVKQEVCEAINKKNGFSNLLPVVPIMSTSEGFGFRGYGSNSKQWLDSGNELEGQGFACFEGNDRVDGATDLFAGKYFVYKVLIAR